MWYVHTTTPFSVKKQKEKTAKRGGTDGGTVFRFHHFNKYFFCL